MSEYKHIGEKLVEYLKKYEVDRVSCSFEADMSLFITNNEIKSYLTGFLTAYYGRNVSIRQVCVNNCKNYCEPISFRQLHRDNFCRTCLCKEKICFGELK